MSDSESDVLEVEDEETDEDEQQNSASDQVCRPVYIFVIYLELV